MKWTEALSVGNRQIDEDHRHLFQLLDKLHEAMRAGKANTVLSDILDELVRYTVSHFQREELFMKRINYRDYASHKGEHDKLIAEVQDLQRRLRSGAITLSLSVNQFLTEWLNTHIMSSDLKLAAALQAA